MSPRRRIRKSGHPSALWDILDKLFSRRGLKSRIRENQVFTVWDQSVGEAIAANARPMDVRDGVLTIEAKNNTWLQELSFLREDIMRELNAAMGWDAIRDLRFRVAGSDIIPTLKPVPDKQPARVETDPSTEREIDRRIEGIDDPELRDALRGFMRRGASMSREGKKAPH